jgi:H+/Cl- antiporter ClcA
VKLLYHNNKDDNVSMTGKSVKSENYSDHCPITTKKRYSYKIHSLDFDAFRSKIIKNRPNHPCKECVSWTIYILIGLSVGMISFIMAWLEDFYFLWKQNYINDCLQDPECGEWGSFYFIMTMAVICSSVAAAMTIYVAPKSAGSGTAEVMGMLNGVNYPGIISVKGFFVKVFGIMLAV